MEYQEELNEFQKKRIKSRLNLDFKQELKKSSELSERKKFSKNFRNSLDILINEMYQDGVMFYGFTILKPYLKAEDPSLWHSIHLQVEYLMNSFKNIELIEFCYLSIELHSGSKQKMKPNRFKSLALLNQNNLEGLPHFHGILGVRSLLGKNSHHYNEIKKIFNDDLDDVMIKPLLNVKAIKGYWNYVIEENNFKFHRFVQYSKIYENLYASISDLELQYDSVEHYAFGLDENLDNKYCDITGVRDLNPLDQTKINYLISLYMQREKIFLFKNNIYTRMNHTKHSWEFLYDIEFFRKNNIMILTELSKIFPQQLDGLKIPKLFAKGWNLFYEDIKKNNHYLPNINFTNDVVEFTDGLYFLNHNYFYDFSKNPDLNLNCYKYFDRSYKRCKQIFPIKWLDCISKTLESKNVNEFCADLGRYFHSHCIVDEKQKSLCIVGASNTGKTTLVSNIVTKIIGLENVGILSNQDSFAFEQIEDKKIIICDEFKYKQGNRSDILNALDNQAILMDKKGEQKKLYVNKVPIMFLFNKETNDKMLGDQSFLNRLLIYTFTYEVTQEIKHLKIKEILEKELPQIMIFCNNLYFEKNKIRFQQIKNKFFNQLKEERMKALDS